MYSTLGLFFSSTLGFERPPDPVLKSFFALEPTPSNVIFRQFMETYIKQAKNQASASPKNNFDKSLNPWKPDIYYSNLYMECYYFYQ